MEKIYGYSKEGMEGNFRKTLMGNRYLNGCVVALCLIFMTTACAPLKKAGIVGASAGLGATAGSVIGGGAIAPIAGSMIGASVASVVTDGGTGAKSQSLEVQADTVVNNAPDNFWTLLGKLTQMGGWALLLIVIVPMLFSWLLPGPIQFKGKKGK